MIEIITTKHSWLLQSESGQIYKLNKVQYDINDNPVIINPKTADLEYLCLCALPRLFQSSNRQAQASCYTELRRVMEEFVKTL